MKIRSVLAITGTAVAALALAACTSATPSGGSASSESTAPPVAAATLSTNSSPLGTIVVDGTGMTAYVFDEDHAGETASACTGACAAAWPAITTTATTPTVSGVTGTVGTITTAGGAHQVTLDGLPLYTYAADRAKGDTNGQGVGGTWWVVGADGAKIGHDAGDDNPSSGGNGGNSGGDDSVKQGY
jgi:predicted lipoprotein with Yx(FWY)xxD motif